MPSLAHLPGEAHHSGIREVANEALRTPSAIRLDVGEPVATYRHRRNVVVDILREADMLISEPSGAFYCMANVSVAPGSAFGEVASTAVGISLASSDADLREGVGRLAEFVHEIS